MIKHLGKEGEPVDDNVCGCNPNEKPAHLVSDFDVHKVSELEEAVGARQKSALIEYLQGIQQSGLHWPLCD